MFLLSQKKTHNLKQEESRAAMEAGMKLANDVDTLRKVKLQQEKELSEQRDAIITQLKRDADELIQLAMNARIELAKTVAENQRALVPIDERWEEIRKYEDAMKDTRLLLDDEHAKCSRNNKILDQKIEQADDNIDRSKEMIVEANKILVRRQFQLEEVQRLSRSLSADIDVFNQNKSQTENQLSNRERRISIREREYDLRVEALNEREREFNLQYANITSNHRR